MNCFIRWTGGIVACVFVLTPVLGIAFELPSDRDSDQKTAAPDSRDANTLREGGQAELERLMKSRQELALQVASAETDAARVSATERLADLDHLIDEVAGARHSCRSGLYWYTDFDEALAEAKRSGRPILTLRMMGNLTDEYSCANSRFFRTALYSNAAISQTLRDKFVLHWKSVRPVPKITIDFGDGRKLHRTITGNSVHYVLTPSGDIIEALPGLYSPLEFSRLIERAHELATAIERQRGFLPIVKQAHFQWQNELLGRWQRDMERAVLEAKAEAEANGDEVPETPDAIEAGLIAPTKSVVEIRLAADVLHKRLDHLEEHADESLWERIAGYHREGATLDDRSRELVGADSFPTALLAAEVAVTKSRVENPILAKIRRFESSIALDTVKNEYLLHRRIHKWFIDGEVPADVDELNERVYAELFLTPSSDPWIGLFPAGTYTALENEGIEISNASNQHD